MQQIKEKYYYVIEVKADNGKRVWHKIGEAFKRSRPEGLVEKYMKRRDCTAKILAFEPLPHNAKVRLNDKTIHANLDQAVMKKADPIHVQHYTDETDGADEFFELVDKKADPVAYVASVVKSLSSSKYYTASNQYDKTLDTPKASKHLVSVKMVEQYILAYGSVYRNLYRSIDNNILLIGQFDFDFIASFGMFHNLVIWHDSAEQKHEYSMACLNNKITYVETLEEIINMDKKFDLIIANPPYGAIGANITEAIINDVDFGDYINLLPANDYKRNKGKDLFNYQSDMKALNAGDNFVDAYVTTHIARIHKNKVNNMTLDEFERSQYIDASLSKYFADTAARKHYAIDATMYKPTLVAFNKLTVEQSIYIGKRDVNNKHLPYSADSIVTKYNKNLITKAEVIAQSAKSEQAFGRVGDFYLIKFNTEIEKTNFANFMYSKDGFRFLCKVFVALNVDSSISLSKVFPKVDWSKHWTVEEILAEYGYTTDEIKEVMDDLKNYKGLD